MKKPLLIFAVAAQLILTSACNIIPDSSSSSSVKNYDNEAERKKMLEMEAFAEEWKVMKPALVNLVALESDLQYMLSNIEQTDGKLMNTTTLQLSLETEEEVAAYETMSFSEGQDITSDFAEESQELEKLSKMSLFADAALLEKLKTSADEISTNLPTENSNEPLTFSEADIFTAAENSKDINLNKGIDVAATAPVAEYLLEKDMPFDTRPIPDIPIVGAMPNDNGRVAVSAQNQYTERKPVVKTTKFDNRSLQQDGVYAKFSTQQGTVSNTLNNSTNVKNAKFQDQNKGSGGKFSTVELGELIDPSHIVGTVNRFTAVNPNSKNLELANACTTTNTAVGDGYALHLASYGSLDNAIKGWKALANTFSNELCGLIALTEKVTVNNKQFFSLRAGGFGTKEMADDTCTQLTNKNQYCRSIRFTGDRLP